MTVAVLFFALPSQLLPKQEIRHFGAFASLIKAVHFVAQNIKKYCATARWLKKGTITAPESEIVGSQRESRAPGSKPYRHPSL